MEQKLLLLKESSYKIKVEKLFEEGWKIVYISGSIENGCWVLFERPKPDITDNLEYFS